MNTERPSTSRAKAVSGFMDAATPGTTLFSTPLPRIQPDRPAAPNTAAIRAAP